MEGHKMKNSMIINCTPHDVAIYSIADCYMHNGSLYLREGDEEHPEPLSVYPAAKKPARAIFAQKVEDMADGILVYRWFPEEVVNLPDPTPGTYYIVSKMLAQACPERKDLIFPGTVVRNESGDVVGCIDFARV